MFKIKVSIAALTFAFAIGTCFPSTDDWSSFRPPLVDLILEDEDHEGIETYKKLVGEQGFKTIEDWVQNCCLVVAREFYYSSQEANQREVHNITYRLKNGGPISYKSGAPPSIEIGFDLNYLIKFIDEHGLIAASDELYGILCHEISHAYQQEPKNAGGYNPETEFFAFIEGSADLARLKTGGFNPPRFPKPGGTYLAGYNTTAFFYLWITNTKNSNFLRDLNRTAMTLENWSLDKAIRELFNKSADELWTLYQEEIENYPWFSETTP